MEDIEFLQHCGGMNPGERFYKIAPHLKPDPSVADTRKYYENMFLVCCGHPALHDIPKDVVEAISDKEKRVLGNSLWEEIGKKW